MILNLLNDSMELDWPLFRLWWSSTAQWSEKENQVFTNPSVHRIKTKEFSPAARLQTRFQRGLCQGAASPWSGPHRAKVHLLSVAGRAPSNHSQCRGLAPAGACCRAGRNAPHSWWWGTAAQPASHPAPRHHAHPGSAPRWSGPGCADSSCPCTAPVFAPGCCAPGMPDRGCRVGSSGSSGEASPPYTPW